MDPKFFSGAQQGIPMTAQQAAANARMMMALQQQQQQQQPQSNDPSMQQYNAMAMGNMGFSGAPNLGNMAFAQQGGGGGDMSSFDQSNFMFMNQVSAQQQQQPFMGQMPQSPANMHAMNQLTQQPQLQQQATSQHPQTSIYASQAGMMPFAPNANNGGKDRLYVLCVDIKGIMQVFHNKTVACIKVVIIWCLPTHPKLSLCNNSNNNNKLP